MAVYVRMHRLPNGFKSNEHETLLEIKKEKSSKIHGKKKKTTAGHYGLWTVYCHSFSPTTFAENVLIIS